MDLAESKGNVLIVDDDRDLGEMIASALESAGFETSVCRNGKDGLKSVGDGHDVVLLDRFLPDLDGDEVLAHIESDPELRHIPVIVMSVDSDEKWMSRLIDGGALDYLVKPVRLDILRAKVAAAVRTKRRREFIDGEEKKVSAIKAELLTIYDSLQEGLLFIDGDSVVQRCNSAALEMLGASGYDEVLGRKGWEVLYGTDAPPEDSLTAAALATGQIAEADRRVDRDGETRMLHVVAIPAGDHVIVSVEDVTALRQKQREEAHMDRVEVVSSLAGASSHEINQPLGVIAGRAQLMQMRLSAADDHDEKLGHDIDEILSATKRIEVIVERLHNVKDYVTKPYVGGREILDVEKSTGVIPRRRPGGEDTDTDQA